jgi:predicted PurR-regulated permease PerM
MLQKIKHKTTQLKQDWHNQIASFKGKVKEHRDQRFPHINREIDEEQLELAQTAETDTHPFSTRRIIIFRRIGLLFVGIGYVLYHTLTYFYMLIFAYILSLAIEGVISFWGRTTRSRGLGIFIAYFLLILLLLSGFIIIVPFLISRGTQMLQSIITYAQSVQTDILTQGIDAYIRGLKWIPDFLNDDILKYIKESNSASLLQTITENLGNIVNISSSYLKTIGGYAVNIFGEIFATAGKLVIIFTLSLFFSISHFEVKYGIKYLFRKVKKSKEKVEEVYSGISSRLRSQLFLCLLIGLASYLGLRILSRCGIDLPQKGVLALIAGLFEIIPYL